MRTFVLVYLAAGFLVGLALFGWLFVASARRHGFRRSIWGAARAYASQFPLYWRVPVAAWTFVIALPLIAAWAIFEGEWDPVGAVFVALLWVGYLALLLWHRRVKARTRRQSGAP